MFSSFASFFKSVESKPIPEFKNISEWKGDQDHLIKKLLKFINYISPFYSGEMRNYLREKDAGLCFGLSVCHAAMDCVGKLNWWEAALRAVADWDETLVALDKLIFLPDAKGSQTLMQIFERVLNYVMFTQSENCVPKLFKINSMDQMNMLDSCCHFFEMSHNEKVITIQSQRKIAGHFSHSQIASLLHEDYIVNAICVVHNIDHTIRIGYKNHQWLIYDSNYLIAKTNKLHKLFSSKKNLVDEISKILGNELTFQISYFDKKERENHPFDIFDEWIKTESIDLIKGFGLCLLACHAPCEYKKLTNYLYKEASEKIIVESLIKQTDEKEQALSFVPRAFLSSLMMKVIHSGQYSQQIAHLLSYKNKKNKTGFELIFNSYFNYADIRQMLPAALECALQTQEGIRLIVKMLNDREKTGNTLLSRIARIFPDQLARLLNNTQAIKDNAEDFVAAFTVIHVQKWTGLHFIAFYAPECLLAALNWIMHVKKGPLIIAEALVAKTDTGCTGLLFLVQHVPQAFIPAMRYVAQDEQGEDLFVRALKSKNNEGLSALKVVQKEFPELVLPIKNLAQQQKKRKIASLGEGPVTRSKKRRLI